MKVHQPIFRRRGNQSTISCACRASYDKHTRVRGGGEYYEPMEILPGETSWETYNRPDNHWVEFTERDKVPA